LRWPELVRAHLAAGPERRGLWEVVLKVVPIADAGNNIARSSEANFRDVKLVPARLWNF
jgi:hypothetical protein